MVNAQKKHIENYKRQEKDFFELKISLPSLELRSLCVFLFKRLTPQHKRFQHNCEPPFLVVNHWN